VVAHDDGDALASKGWRAWAGEHRGDAWIPFPGSVGAEGGWRVGLRCAAGAAAMADGGELDSGELEAGAEVGELLRD